MSDDTLFPDLFVPWEEVARDEIAAFEGALDGARDERDIQRFLEGHPRMLIQQISGHGAWVIPQKALGSEHVTDFLIAQKSSGGFVWYAVELERPQAKVFNKNGDPSAALNHALRQIGDWRDWLSNNRDYAARPRERSGLGLIDIDPELEGLVIIGRDTSVNHGTTERRRRLMRERRVKIETYDWLLTQARERLETLERAGDRNRAADPLDTLLNSPRLERPAEKAVEEVFGGIFGMSTSVSETRDIDWEGIDLNPDYPDVIAPLKIVYAWGREVGKPLQQYDWEDWIENLVRHLDFKHSLLVTEKAPAESLHETLTLEQEGVWYAAQGSHMFLHVDVLVHLPPAISHDEKKGRVALAREVMLRYENLEYEKMLEWKREAELKVISLSLAPGDRVEHDRFGFGIVQSTSGSGTKAEAVIDFGEEFGVKHLAVAYAPLKKL